MTMDAMEPLRVLVVDDSDTFRSAMVQYLNSLDGIESVDEAKSGREAFMMVRGVSPDVVLLDISMPGLNGVEVAGFIKRYSPETRVVFVTIHDEESYRAIVRDVHADGFVNKDHLRRDLAPLLTRFRRRDSGTSTRWEGQ
jgi:DNA-binding NarL/FixJ family response regulator